VSAHSDAPSRAWKRPFAAITRQLPFGWGHFLAQLAIFATFDIAYELSRGRADGARDLALRHAEDVVSVERTLGIFGELDVQHWTLQAPAAVEWVANWTYFNCQFTISFLFVLWAYLRRTDDYYRIRNVLITADFLGVIGYVLYPTAPPRMLTSYGFADTLNATRLNHHSGLISAFSNPYAAMPSLHTAYAITIGVSGVLLTRRIWWKAIWAFYPVLVVFSIVATGNHFLLDAAAGAAVLGIAFPTVVLAERRWPVLRGRRLHRAPADSPLSRPRVSAHAAPASEPARATAADR
jgi:membrane-associated phospholipid phosphatase